MAIKVYNKTYINTISIVAYICDVCNYNCWYCYNNKPRTNNYINLNKLFNFLLDLNVKFNKQINITLIGGEPTLHYDLIEFCNKCYQTGFIKVIIYTNFSLNIDFYNNLINKYDCNLLISFHLNQCNNLEFVNKLIKISNRNNIQDINIIIDPKHFQKCIDTFNYIFYTLKFNVAEPTLIKSKTDKKIKTIKSYQNIYSKQQLQTVNNICNKIKSNDQLIIEYNNKIINNIDITHIDQLNINFYLWKCNAGYSFLYIDQNEQIYPCTLDENNKNKILGSLTHYAHIIFKPIICQHKICYCGLNIIKTSIFKNQDDNFIKLVDKCSL